MEVVLLVLVIVLIIAVGFLIVRQNSQKPEDLSKQVEAKLNEIFPSVLKNANEQLVLMANEKLEAQKKEINTDVVNKKDAIEKLVKQVLEELTKNANKLEDAEMQRMKSFGQLKEKLEAQNILTEKLSVTTENLKKVLSNNQMRGQFGEQVADDLLRMTGFVRGTDYEFNKKQEGSETRPDFCIFLPDGARINVDSKFPFSNLQKMSETDEPTEKTKYAQAFRTDVKNKIKQVTTRDYINPEDNTVDFVILFIPNEMIFSYIYEKMNDIWLDGMQSKVILAGPFSFSAILRMVRQAYNNFKYQQNTQKIISYIKIFEKEFEKYNEEFQKIGDRISSLSKQYELVDRTRTNQLIKSIDKIRLEETDTKTEVAVSIEKNTTKTTIGLDL